jgi:hypothetical protein
MTFKDYNSLIDLDYLVFSSHKTATQTIVHSLRTGGLNASHCHVVGHIGIENGNFLDFVTNYKLINKKPLKIISIYREPVERLISSFFQSFGSDPIDFKQVDSEKETLIYKNTVLDLQKIFIEKLNAKKMPGFYESLGLLANELKIDVTSLQYDDEKRIGININENFNLYLIRFDHLISQFNLIISTIANKELQIAKANLSEKKWYYNKYQDFKASINIPVETIESLYDLNKKFICLFYKDQKDKLFRSVTEQYASS